MMSITNTLETQKEKRRLTLRSTALLLVLFGFNYLFSFSWQAYLTRVLGAETYGHVFYLDKLLLSFAYIFDLGYFVVGGDKWQLAQSNRKRIVSAILYLKVITAGISFLILLLIERLFLSKTANNCSYLVYIFFIALLLEKLLPDFIYRVEHRMAYLLAYNLISRILLFTLLITLVKAASNYVMIPIIYAFSAFVLLTIAFFDLAKKNELKLTIVDINYLKLVFIESLNLAGTKLANCLFNACTVLALHYANTEQKILGYFILLDMLFITGRKVLNLLGESFYLHLHKTADYKWYSKVAAILALLLLLALIIVYLKAEILLTLVFGETFKGAYIYLHLFLIAALPACLSSLIAYPLLAAQNKVAYVNYSCFSSTGIYAFSIVCLIIFAKINIINLLFAYIFSIYSELAANIFALIAYNRQKEIRS